MCLKWVLKPTKLNFDADFQVASKVAFQSAKCNQTRSVVMNVIFDAQQRFSGCAAGMSRECFDSGEDETHETISPFQAELDMVRGLFEEG